MLDVELAGEATRNDVETAQGSTLESCAADDACIRRLSSAAQAGANASNVPNPPIYVL